MRLEDEPGGTIARAPTWDADDLGVSFVTTGTTIPQVTEENTATCILFTTVADVDPSAAMTLGLDFNNDGTIDYSTPIVGNWQRVQSQITAPANYNGITFSLSKGGTGTAVLAEIRVQATTGCTAAPVVPQGPLALGESCTTNSQCATGLLCDGDVHVCAQCTFGGQSTCDPGVACVARPYTLTGQCGPGQHLGGHGAPCFGDDDCKSGQCTGASFMFTGDAGADAAEADAGVDGGACDLELVDAGVVLAPTTCVHDAVIGGTCQ